MLPLLLVTSIQNMYIHHVKGLGLKTFILDSVSSSEANEYIQTPTPGKINHAVALTELMKLKPCRQSQASDQQPSPWKQAGSHVLLCLHSKPDVKQPRSPREACVLDPVCHMYSWLVFHFHSWKTSLSICGLIMCHMLVLQSRSNFSAATETPYIW